MDQFASTPSEQEVLSRAASGTESMRSHSKNLMLSESASKSDDDALPNPAGSQQIRPAPFVFPNPPISNGTQASHFVGYHQGPGGSRPGAKPTFPPPHHYSMGQHSTRLPPQGLAHQPTILDLHYKIQEMEQRLQHLELMVFTNSGYNRPINPGMAVATIDPMLPTEDALNQRGDLDRVCLPALEKHAHPPSTVLNEICRALETQFKHVNRNEMLSLIRRWFRKRREEMSQRIFNATRKALSTREYSRDELFAMGENLKSDDAFTARIRREANLEIADEEEAMDFTHKKIISFLKRTAEELP